MEIEVSNNYSRLASDSSEKDIEIYKQIRKNLCVKAPGADYIKAHKEYKYSKGKRGWDGLVSALHVEGVFPTGLLPEVIFLLEKSNQKIDIIDKRIPPIVNVNSTSVELFDYQKDAVKNALSNRFLDLWWPRGVLGLATGAGKTEIAISIYEMVKIPSLFLVHRKTLGWQTVKRFKKYVGNDVGILFDGEKELNPSGITVATTQTIISKIV